jgi:hypothetical protein
LQSTNWIIQLAERVFDTEKGSVCHYVKHRFKGIRQYIFLLFHFKELLKSYVNLLYRFCVTLLFLEIFWLQIICCPPSWINFYHIGDFSDVISRVSHIKLHLNDQITLGLVWKFVRQFFISNSYCLTEVYDFGLIITNCSIWIKFLRDPAYDVTCMWNNKVTQNR